MDFFKRPNIRLFFPPIWLGSIFSLWGRGPVCKWVDFSILSAWGSPLWDQCPEQCGVPRTGQGVNGKAMSGVACKNESGAGSKEGSQETLLENWGMGQDPHHWDWLPGVWVSRRELKMLACSSESQYPCLILHLSLTHRMPSLGHWRLFQISKGFESNEGKSTHGTLSYDHVPLLTDACLYTWVINCFCDFIFWISMGLYLRIGIGTLECVTTGL